MLGQFVNKVIIEEIGLLVRFDPLGIMSGGG